MDPKDDTQLPGGVTPLSGSNVADEPTQPIKPVTPVSKPMVGIGISTPSPKGASVVPPVSQEEPLSEEPAVGRTSTGLVQDEPTATGMGSSSIPTTPVVDEPLGATEPEETTEEPTTNPTLEPDKTSTEDTGSGGMSGL